MSVTTTDVDIAICGAGPVGQALALLLIKRGVPADRIVLIDARTVEQARQDARSIALSYGSRQLLEGIGVWPISATEIHQIHVSRRGHFGRTLIDCDDYQLPALGYVARYGNLVTPLNAAIEQTGIVVKRPLQVTAIDEGGNHATVVLADHSLMTARIVVQAEGGNFGEQRDQHERAQHRDYRQTAVIAHISVSRPLPHRAFERFTEQGPLALLPQADAQGDGYAVVWCVRPDTAQDLLALDDADFMQQLQVAFGERLGRILNASKRSTYPLGLNAQPQATARTVSIGNAAQTLHPVAGQGLNLGLRDAAVLAEVLSKSLATGFQTTSLQDYLKQRAADRNSVIRITDSMARLFASAPDGALSQTLLGLGLGLLDGVAPARKLLAEQMMFGWR
ncbi:UbiH/UbiF/VisC/COQ6 family ubiquinone biosynthesis hydroxylase [Undibacterium arcticum]|uniref:UbiH/UbiF/VisC/COQ6 family ubiquinone biosynthesis hydroxylase n=1 Tax=Undibacterium arcticum TaxID=1762892 RepID=UPI003619B2F8